MSQVPAVIGPGPASCESREFYWNRGFPSITADPFESLEARLQTVPRLSKGCVTLE